MELPGSFPPKADAAAFRRWLWLFHPQDATAEQWEAWRQADRYSFEEMAALADQEAFHGRRMRLHVEAMQRSLCRWFRHDSGFSAADLAHALDNSAAPETLDSRRAPRGAAAGRVANPQNPSARPSASPARSTRWARHSGKPRKPTDVARTWLVETRQSLDAEMHDWLDRRGLGLSEELDAGSWTGRARVIGFRLPAAEDRHRRTAATKPVLRSALRSDEIAWGRAPARLDLAGGWSDTPPYTLENGGTVLNAAVLLNGQPPVQVYGRVTAEPVIRVRSIDLGTHLDIQVWDELFDCSSAVGAFSLVKAALVISGFTPLERRIGDAIVRSAKCCRASAAAWKSPRSPQFPREAGWAPQASWEPCCWPSSIA